MIPVPERLEDLGLLSERQVLERHAGGRFPRIPELYVIPVIRDRITFDEGGHVPDSPGYMRVVVEGLTREGELAEVAAHGLLLRGGQFSEHRITRRSTGLAEIDLAVLVVLTFNEISHKDLAGGG